MAHVKDWMALAEPDPEWTEAVNEKMGGHEPDLGIFPDIPSMRSWITESKKAMAAQMGNTIDGVKEHDENVTMRDGATIVCRIHAPEKAPEGGSPLAVIYHGGGWCIGGLENEELLCRLLASRLGVTCVNVDYRLAPEHVFPTAIHDCHDATKWAAANASSFGADPSKGFIIGGTSAGGQLTAAMAHIWRDEKTTPKITGCLLMIPFYIYHAAVPEKYKPDYNSWEQNKKAAILSREACNLFVDNYCPNEKDRSDPLLSVLLWPTGHADLPPSYFQIAGLDPLRDEALIFERLMREDEGIKTKVDVYPGQPHGFFSVLPTMKASQKFVEDSVNGVKWLLEQK